MALSVSKVIVRDGARTPTAPTRFFPIQIGTTKAGYRTTSAWCRGWSRYVEGCWRFPYLEIKRFLGFLVFDFKSLLYFQKIFVTYYQFPLSCLLIDIAPISKTFEILLDGSSSISSACLFQNCQDVGFLKFRDFYRSYF